MYADLDKTGFGQPKTKLPTASPNSNLLVCSDF